MKIYRTNTFTTLNLFNYLVILSIFLPIIISFITQFSTDNILSESFSLFMSFIPYIVFLGGILLLNFLFAEKKQKSENKNTIIQKIITILSLIFYFLVIGILMFFVIQNFSFGKTYRQPKDYQKALNQIHSQNKIIHFPSEIPNDAENIQFYSSISENDEEIILLKLKTNNNYINKELSKYKFLNSDTALGTPQKIYHMYTDNNRIKIDGLTWYVINDDENRKFYQKYFPYYSGVGINKNLDEILYYYIRFGD